MTYTYWINKQGGLHYHKEDCQMTKDPKFHYEPITRSLPRIRNFMGVLTRIREGGKYYMACSCFFGKRG